MTAAPTTEYARADDQPELVLVPTTTFLSITGAGAPATAVWHRKKRLVADLARQLSPGVEVAEHLRYHYLDSVTAPGIADFYSVHPLTELHYRALARVRSDVTLDDIAAARRALRSDDDADDEIELISIPEQLVIQVMHHGPFAGELDTLARLGEAADELGVVRNGPHQEIHLDPFAIDGPQDNLRTILRDPVGPRDAVDIGSAEDRLAAAEALYRYAAGIDLKDDDLLASAFAPDAILDLSRATATAGLTFPPIEGRTQIVTALSASLTALDTTHSVSNPRVTVTGNRAQLEAIVAAQHLPHGDHSRNVLMTNRYELDLVRSGHLWRIARLSVDNAWTAGDTTVLTAG